MQLDAFRGGGLKYRFGGVQLVGAVLEHACVVTRPRRYGSLKSAYLLAPRWIVGVDLVGPDHKYVNVALCNRLASRGGAEENARIRRKLPVRDCLPQPLDQLQPEECQALDPWRCQVVAVEAVEEGPPCALAADNSLGDEVFKCAPNTPVRGADLTLDRSPGYGPIGAREQRQHVAVECWRYDLEWTLQVHGIAA